MRSPFQLKTIFSALLVTATLATSVSALAADAPPVRLRGEVSKVTGDSVDLKVRGKVETVKLAKDLSIFAIDHAAIADIKSDSFVGTTAIPQPDGTLKAMEVHIFPPGVKAGEGSYAWDLTPKSTMTNGTVGSVVVASGRTITVKYPNGEKKVTVPADVPVVVMSAGDRSLLVPGAHVVFFMKKAADGSQEVGRAAIGKGSVVPPM